MFCAMCALFDGVAEAQSPPAAGERFHNNYPHEGERSFWLWK